MAATLSVASSRAGVMQKAMPRGMKPLTSRAVRMVVRADASPKPQAVQPINGDPFIGMFETPITSTPEVASFLSGLPGYRTGISPLLRGVEIGLAHGFFLPGPFIKLGPLRNVVGEAEIAGCLSAAGLVVILTAALSIYGSAAFQKTVVSSAPANIGVKTLSGRQTIRDPLQTADGWSNFSAGWLVGGISGVAWCYILTQTLPYYNLSP